MSLLQPKKTQQFPPQGWPFKDERTGFKCNGMEGTPQMHAVKIIAHRRANPNFYPKAEGQWFDMNSVVQEIYAQKFKTHPYLFRGQPDKGPPIVRQAEEKSHVSPTVTCSKCGGNEFVNRYCRSCSGKRIVGITCSKCGNEQ